MGLFPHPPLGAAGRSNGIACRQRGQAAAADSDSSEDVERPAPRDNSDSISVTAAASSILRAIRTVGVAMLVTSATLLGGFSVMMISHLPSIQIFAQMASVAILAALFGDLVMLPALLACFVRRR